MKRYIKYIAADTQMPDYYEYLDPMQELQSEIDNYIDRLKDLKESDPSHIRSSIPILKKQRDKLIKIYKDTYERIYDNEDFVSSLWDAFRDIIYSGLGDFPSIIKQQLRKYGIPANIVSKDKLTLQDFYISDSQDSLWNLPDEINIFKLKGNIIDSDYEISISDIQNWWEIPRNLKNDLNSKLNDIIKRSRVPMCTSNIYFTMYVSAYDADKLFDYTGMDNWKDIYRYYQIDAIGDRIPEGKAELSCSINTSVGIVGGLYGYVDILKESMQGDKDLKKLDNMVYKGMIEPDKTVSTYSKPSYEKSKFKSSEWSKTINLRNYFPEECFDENGNFDGDVADEEDWIQFNEYELKNGFGDYEKLYAAVLNMTGFPAYIDFINDCEIDNDGNMEFIMYGDEDYNIPDIRFGFYMEEDGDMATVELSWAGADDNK